MRLSSSKNDEAPMAATIEASKSPVNYEKTDMNSLAKENTSFTIFKFDSKDVRVVVKDGEPWFVAADLCEVLQLDSTAIRKLDDDEKGLHSMQTLGGRQDMAVVAESGMFTLILRCRDAVKPGTTPYRVRKWVTAEVLPTIRKTGEYKQTGKRDVAKHDVAVNADDLLFKLNLICTTWDAARSEIAQFDPKMADHLDKTMNMFWMYTANMKGIASKKQSLRLN